MGDGADGGKTRKKTGRPPKYAEAEAMAKAVEGYFSSLKRDADLGDIPPTMADLARALGFNDRHSLHDYEDKPEFSAIVKRARLRVEGYWERRLATTSPTGAIFWLKNHANYADKTELTGKDGSPLQAPVVNVILSGNEP